MKDIFSNPLTEKQKQRIIKKLKRCIEKLGTTIPAIYGDGDIQKFIEHCCQLDHIRSCHQVSLTEIMRDIILAIQIKKKKYKDVVTKTSPGVWKWTNLWLKKEHPFIYCNNCGKYGCVITGLEGDPNSTAEGLFVARLTCAYCFNTEGLISLELLKQEEHPDYKWLMAKKVGMKI